MWNIHEIEFYAIAHNTWLLCRHVMRRSGLHFIHIFMKIKKFNKNERFKSFIFQFWAAVNESWLITLTKKERNSKEWTLKMIIVETKQRIERLAINIVWIYLKHDFAIWRYYYVVVSFAYGGCGLHLIPPSSIYIHLRPFHSRITHSFCSNCWYMFRGKTFRNTKDKKREVKCELS